MFGEGAGSLGLFDGAPGTASSATGGGAGVGDVGDGSEGLSPFPYSGPSPTTPVLGNEGGGGGAEAAPTTDAPLLVGHGGTDGPVDAGLAMASGEVGRDAGGGGVGRLEADGEVIEEVGGSVVVEAGENGEGGEGGGHGDGERRGLVSVDVGEEGGGEGTSAANGSGVDVR